MTAVRKVLRDCVRSGNLNSREDMGGCPRRRTPLGAVTFGGNSMGLWVSLDNRINTGYPEKRVGTAGSEAAMKLV